MTNMCIACGMPMEKKEDYAMGDETLDYCLHCANPDGSMRSYEDTLKGFTGFMMKEKGCSEAEAREMVIGLMAELPAWKDR